MESLRALLDVLILHNKVIHIWNLFTNTMRVVIFFDFTISTSILVGFSLVSCVSTIMISFKQYHRIFLKKREMDVHAVATTLGFFGLTMFMYCALGQMVLNQCAMTSEELYSSCRWYAWPKPLQHNFLIIMKQMQQPLHIKAIGASSLECSLENYSNVNRFELIPIRFLSIKISIVHFQLLKFSYSLLTFMNSVR